MIRPLDTAALGPKFRNAKPFPSICIDDILDPHFALEVADSYPSFEQALCWGRRFDAVNERLKVQVSDPQRFPPPVRRLASALADPLFISTLSEISGIPDLIWDDDFLGGGMHLTAPPGYLDVHVDFNRVESHGIYRRLNLLIYLNREWRDEWGGDVDLWDSKVEVCHARFPPKLNRAVMFATSEISFHGVRQVTSPPEISRQSFAVYYYTRQAPDAIAEPHHSTLFRARPEEKRKRYLEMPLEKAIGAVARGCRNAARAVRRLWQRDSDF